MAQVMRPIGITLLAVLHVVEAVFLFFVGVALLALGAFVRHRFFGMHFLHWVVSLIGVVVLVVGILYLGLAWGLWSGRGWAWTISFILAVLGIIVTVVSLARGRLGALVGLVLDAVILYYLFTPKVRAFFGEYGTTAPAGTRAIPPSSESTSGGGTRFCSNCGSSAGVNEKFCANCGKPLN